VAMPRRSIDCKGSCPNYLRGNFAIPRRNLAHSEPTAQVVPARAQRLSTAGHYHPRRNEPRYHIALVAQLGQERSRMLADGGRGALPTRAR
jgi:hypothetical protein